ncbi:hypothetical protein GIB67_035995 [Kingdonia uniflora]|uniref:Uncharacterized protein n=1 Tax=Kingdonia uniflora TaxID=39325 RepID=A0A7J7N172_9MAGN|nr:hypothetical protein GIB67_035995 [Kingdonia uniflora]
MLARKLSPSKLKHHLLLYQLSTFSTTTTTKPFLNPTLIPNTTPFHPFCKTFSSNHPKPKPLSIKFTRDGNYDETISQSVVICPGCGVQMQETDSKLPGFFIKPSKKDPNYKVQIDWQPIAEESEISNSFKRGNLKELGEPEELDVDDASSSMSSQPVVCARCHSLRHYGKVKDVKVENLLPDFDFDHTIGRKLVSLSGTRSTVLMVVDAADFIGSFPSKVAKLVSGIIDESSTDWRKGKSGNVPRVVLVVTKIDLLPSSISPNGLEFWVRQRAREGGANKLTSVHLVSAVKSWGIKDLVEDIRGLAGARGNVWAIGAQNAGKSTLINSIGKCVVGNITQITEAPVPGTTLGIIRVEGVLPGKAKLFDTPGLLNPHQITTRLTREEQKMVNISKELKPRTYRLKAGYTVHIAGLMRLDVEKLSIDSIYLTVWASPHLPLHMGKIANASTMLRDYFGRQLQPPIGDKRVEELGIWVRKEFHVSGNSWNVSAVDIAAAGLGWFAVGLKGEAVLGAWTYDGVDVTVHNSLIPHRSRFFEVPGFTVSKIVSNADRSLNKQLRDKKEKKQDYWEEVVSETLPAAVGEEDSSPC